MARRYSAWGRDTNTVNITVFGLTSTTAIRPRIYDFIIGSEATPADQAARMTLQRTTTTGTSTAVTPIALDPSDPAATFTAGENHSGEPTYTASALLLQLALNQRATFRWVAAPGGEIVLPATASNGAALFAAVVTSAYVVTVQTYVEE